MGIFQVQICHGGHQVFATKRPRARLCRGSGARCWAQAQRKQKMRVISPILFNYQMGHRYQTYSVAHHHIKKIKISSEIRCSVIGFGQEQTGIVMIGARVRRMKRGKLEFIIVMEGCILHNIILAVVRLIRLFAFALEQERILVKSNSSFDCTGMWH